MPRDEKTKALLSDLGRATLRGVRKCPKCGTFNGTRGVICKNKSCDVVFKQTGTERRKHSTESCKLVTGSNAQIYSVRMRDKGPDYRGFVQLPLIQGLDTGQQLDGDTSLVAQSTARCFVESCPRANQEKLGEVQMTCQHIKAALKCFTEARPLTLKNSVLNSLPVASDTKQLIWLLATETTGPLVQRVSKTIMAVKCKPSPKHPIGYLHFSFYESKNKDRIEHKFSCSCKAFKSSFKGMTVKDEVLMKRCVHFYACICAFSSDEALAEEFAFFISLDARQRAEAAGPQPEKLVAFLGDSPGRQTRFITSPCEVEVEVLQEDSATLVESFPVTDSGELTEGLDLCDHVEVQLQTEDGDTVTLPAITEDLGLTEQIQTFKRRREDPVVQASSALLTLQDTNIILRKSPKKSVTTGVKTKPEPVDENEVSISFIQWLASVTERINQTMHFQFNGQPEPLVFHVPQMFFDCLRERISVGCKKKRLPNHTTGFVRKGALPLGTFTKYTWQLTNILHVKQIFDTVLMPLQITRSFLENRDGTFDLFEPGDNENEHFHKVGNQQLIKPLELKTFLKVGHTMPEQKEPTPFLIEWIPDILPQMKIGELRIKFEYGHQRNGQLDKRMSQPLALPVGSSSVMQM